jgi:hypothetical protein
LDEPPAVPLEGAGQERRFVAGPPRIPPHRRRSQTQRKAVAHQLKDAAVMLRDLRLKQLLAVCRKRSNVPASSCSMSRP